MSGGKGGGSRLSQPRPSKPRKPRTRDNWGRKRKQPPRKAKQKSQKGGKLDIQKWLSKTGLAFHWPGYHYMGPGTNLKKRLARGDKGINRLDNIAMHHDIDHSKAKNLRAKHAADRKMIRAIEKLPGKKTWTEKIVKNIMKGKLALKM